MSLAAGILANISVTLVIMLGIMHYDEIKGTVNAKERKRRRVNSRATKAINQSSNISPLDYIMETDKMSERDQAWYELYKRYGCRNHTWQDFRDMFNNDLGTACKTVKHWMTWDQINATRHQADKLHIKVQSLLRKHNMQAIAEVSYKHLEKKYPDLVAKYEQFLTLYYLATPNYCTYDPKLARIKRKYGDKIAERRPSARYIMEMDKLIDLRNADFVVGERLEKYYRIILCNPEITENILDDKMSMKKKLKLIRKILDGSTRFHGAIHTFVTLDKNLESGGAYMISVNEIKFKTSLIRRNSVWDILSLIIHEDTHRIDHNNPDFGMLGAQIMELQPKIYIHTKKRSKKLYYKTPVEQIAYFIDNIVGDAIKRSLVPNQR